MRNFAVIKRTCFMLCCCVTALPVLADDSDPSKIPDELTPFYLRIGAFFLDSSTAAQVDGRGGNFGSRLNFEDDLNVKKREQTLLAAARWRFLDRHFIELEYFDLKRFGSERIDEEIRFGDEMYPVGADVKSSFTTEVTRIGYGYRVVRRSEWGLALSAGVHVTRLNARLDSVVLDSGGIPDLQLEIASLTAPLPVLGFSGVRRLGKKWSLAGKGQWFFLQADNVDGALAHAAVYLEYQAYEKVGFGIGFDWFDIDVDSTDKNWRGSADVRFNGPLVFVQASF